MLQHNERTMKLAEDLRIVSEIHPDDFIFKFQKQLAKDGGDAIEKYYRVGRYSADMLASEMLKEVSRVKNRLKGTALGQPSDELWQPEIVLDFAAGYWCVARHLPNVFPNSQIVGCDFHEAAVEFFEKKLGLSCGLSSSRPEELTIPEADLIIALSFFSHMPKRTFSSWLEALTEKLKDGGVLIFTTRGYLSHTISRDGIEVVNDFGFKSVSEQEDLDTTDYGLTVSYVPFVAECVKRCDGIRLVLFREGLWWNHQDVYVCMREDLGI